MKTNELTEALRAELYDNKWCQQDFEKYDVDIIRESPEPFFWLCRTNGTSLMRCGIASLLKQFSNERGRFEVFRNPNAPIEGLLYYKNSAYPQKMFYWDGFSVQRITFDELEEIWHNLSSSLLGVLREEHSEEWEAREDILEIKFASDETARRYREALEVADNLADDSLARCVEGLRHHSRISMCHHILIGSDFVKYGFQFTEVIAGNPYIVGGIIPDFHKEHDRWQIHT